MLLTKKLLAQAGATQGCIKFFEKNKLFGFPLSKLSAIKGDYNGFITWLKERTFIVDSNNNLIRIDYKDGYWYVNEYDLNNNVIRIKDNDNNWYANEYDSNNNVIRVDYKSGYWYTNEYDSNNNLIRIDDKNGYWYTQEYDLNNNLIRSDDNYGNWYTKIYDANNVIRHEDGDGITNYKIRYYDNGQLKSINNLYIPFIDIQE